MNEILKERMRNYKDALWFYGAKHNTEFNPVSLGYTKVKEDYVCLNMNNLQARTVGNPPYTISTISQDPDAVNPYYEEEAPVQYSIMRKAYISKYHDDHSLAAATYRVYTKGENKIYIETYHTLGLTIYGFDEGALDDKSNLLDKLFLPINMSKGKAIRLFTGLKAIPNIKSLAIKPPKVDVIIEGGDYVGKTTLANELSMSGAIVQDRDPFISAWVYRGVNIQIAAEAWYAHISAHRDIAFIFMVSTDEEITRRMKLRETMSEYDADAIMYNKIYTDILHELKDRYGMIENVISLESTERSDPTNIAEAIIETLEAYADDRK